MPKQVGGTVSVSVTPNPLPNATTSVAASGNVASNSSCRKDRTIRFRLENGTTVGPEVGTATSRSNGNYTATPLPSRRRSDRPASLCARPSMR